MINLNDSNKIYVNAILRIDGVRKYIEIDEDKFHMIKNFDRYVEVKIPV